MDLEYCLDTESLISRNSVVSYDVRANSVFMGTVWLRGDRVWKARDDRLNVLPASFNSRDMAGQAIFALYKVNLTTVRSLW